MFLSFPKSRDKLDRPYFHSWIETEKYPELSGIEHINLTPSHGQTSIERVYCEQGHIRRFALFDSIWWVILLVKLRGWSLQLH